MKRKMNLCPICGECDGTHGKEVKPDALYVYILKPCPFCGEQPTFNTNPAGWWNDNNVTYDIACYKCKIAMEKLFPTPEEAVKAWNRRAGE